MKKGIAISTKDGRRVVEGMGYYTPRKIGDLRELVKDSAARYGKAVGFKFKDKEGRITGKTYEEFDREIDCLGTALLSLGLKGAHIAVIGENRYEWGVCYFSIINGTGVGVPLDKNLPGNEVENLIERGKVEAIFYGPAFGPMISGIALNNTRIKYFICMEDPGESIVEKSEASVAEDPRFTTLPALIARGRELLDAGDRSFVEAPINREEMSILLFTSGTTSISKGVMLSHANIAANVMSISSILYAGPGDTYLSLLPLHHTFENTVGLMFMVYAGGCIAYCDGIKRIAQNLKEYNITLLVAVPAIFEAMYKKLQDGIKKEGKEKLFRILTGVSDILRTLGIDVRRKLFKSVFEKIGPGLRLAVSGAAPLDPDVIIGFDKIGFRLLQGYGLTEASPVVATNNDFVNRPGTIGHPLGGVEVAIDEPDEDGMGELVVRGGNVMLGYYEDPAATAETIDSGGWLRTGDLAVIDKDGFIRITGRAKSMIVFTNGKKAFPEEYEMLLNGVKGVKDSYVWGNRAPDGDVQVCAKFVVDKEKLLEDEGVLPSEQELAARFGAAIKEINKTLPQYKIIRYFVMTFEDLIKTTTLKIKRPVEDEKIAEMLKKAGTDMRRASGRIIESLITKD